MTGTPPNVTTLPFCVVPKPAPLISTWFPIAPVVAETLVMTGGGAAAEEVDTLSNVAVAKAVVLPLETAKPMYTFCAIVIVCVVPICTQFIPSGNPYPGEGVPAANYFHPVRQRQTWFVSK